MGGPNCSVQKVPSRWTTSFIDNFCAFQIPGCFGVATIGPFGHLAGFLPDHVLVAKSHVFHFDALGGHLVSQDLLESFLTLIIEVWDPFSEELVEVKVVLGQKLDA